MRALWEATQLALRAISSYKLRTFLTTFGITIGVFAITLTFTLVDSLQYSVSKNLRELGNTVFYVHKWPWKDNSDDWYKYYRRPEMSYSDYAALEENLANASAVNFRVSKFGATLKAGKMDVPDVTVRGITYDYAQIHGFGFRYGRYFSPIEIKNGRPVCVIGYQLAQDLFGNVNPVGRQVRIKGERFEVVGMIAYQGEGIFGGTRDDDFLIPYQRFARLYDLNGERMDKVVTVKAASRAAMPTVEQQIIGLLRQARGLRPGAENNFAINKQETLMNRLDRVFGVLNIGGTFISIFSLLVGGFGIANIMFVAVKERTQEIGMQMAVGAPRTFILAEFLIEAVILCLIGAVIGILLLLGGALAAELILARLAVDMTIVTSASTLSLGLLFAILTGLVSGLLPAWQASRLQPVDAIRAG